MLFFASFRKKPNLFRKLRDNRLTQSIIRKISILKQIHKYHKYRKKIDELSK